MRASEALRDSAVELAWSLWSELGVPRGARRHSHTVIDPEPLIIATPTLAEGDPRLLEQVFGWCVAHSDRISASRLKGLLRVTRGPVSSRFLSFCVPLKDHGVGWPAPDSAAPWTPPSRIPSPPLPLERPSLLRFRLRALSGVGARADILCELLSTPDAWRSTAELARIGYTKRNTARVLSELDGAGIVARRTEGNTYRYRLERPATLEELLGATDLTAPAWRPLLGLVLDLLLLLEYQASPTLIRRIEANKVREPLVQACQLLDMESPPPTRGDPGAWDVILTWATEQVRGLAMGTSSATGN